MKYKLPQDASLRVQIPLVQVLAGELAPAFLNYYYKLVHCLLRSDLRTRKNQSQTMSSRQKIELRKYLGEFLYF